MKKRLIIITLALVSFLMTSCSNVRFAFKNRKLIESTYTSFGVDFLHDTINFIVKDDRILVETMVDGKLDTVFVDTGFNGELVQTHPIKDLTSEYTRVKMGGAQKTSYIYEKLDTVHYSFLWEHLGLKMDICLNLNMVCGKDFSDYPIIGMKAIYPGSSYNKMNINFSDGQFTYYKNNNDSIFDLTGYKPIKCKFRWHYHQLYVYPVINGVEYECLFDTGNIGYLTLRKNSNNSQKQEDDIICEGSWGIAISGVENGGEIIVRNNEIVTLGDEEFNATVCYVNNTKYNNMGLKFISLFDWYLDSGTMYYKPRNVGNSDYQPQSPYRIIASNKGLMVIMKVVDDKNTLQFGDIITSVNGVEITNENICYYNELLNNTLDWSNLEIVVSR